MARIKPSGMPSERWTQLKARAKKHADAGEGSTKGEWDKRYNQALGFYVGRWKGKAPALPKGMKAPSKKYPKGHPPSKRSYLI